MSDFVDDRDLDRGNRLIGSYLAVLILIQLFVFGQPAIASLFSQGGLPVARLNLHANPSDEAVALAADSIRSPDQPSGTEVVSASPEPLQIASEVSSETLLDEASVSEGRPQLGLGDLEFDLRTLNGDDAPPPKLSNKALELKKPLYSGAKELGLLSISVDGNAQVFVQKAALSSLLSNEETLTSKLSRLPDENLISFRSLRDYGINLRYEPVSDQIVLQTR